jgi:hypothetical protein
MSLLILLPEFVKLFHMLRVHEDDLLGSAMELHLRSRVQEIRRRVKFEVPCCIVLSKIKIVCCCCTENSQEECLEI